MSDEILKYIKSTVDRIEAKQDKHETRIVDMEKWQSNADGKITMVGLFGVTLGGVFTAVIEYFRH